jgi:hypothetical protein
MPATNNKEGQDRTDPNVPAVVLQMQAVTREQLKYVGFGDRGVEELDLADIGVIQNLIKAYSNPNAERDVFFGIRKFLNERFGWSHPAGSTGVQPPNCKCPSDAQLRNRRNIVGLQKSS